MTEDPGGMGAAMNAREQSTFVVTLAPPLPVIDPIRALFSRYRHNANGGRLRGPARVSLTGTQHDRAPPAEPPRERANRAADHHRCGGAEVAARSESAGREVHITNEEPPHDVQPRSGSP